MHIAQLGEQQTLRRPPRRHRHHLTPHRTYRVAPLA